MFNQVDPTGAEMVEHFILAVHSMDEMVKVMDGNAERAIGFMMLAAAFKGGQPALDFMRRYLPAIDEKAIAAGEAMFTHGYKPATRQRRQARARKVSSRR